MQKTIFALGDRGVGKTDIASAVIDDLSTRSGAADLPVSIVYRYCDVQHPDPQNSDDSLSPSITSQLSAQGITKRLSRYPTGLLDRLDHCHHMNRRRQRPSTLGNGTYVVEIARPYPSI